MKNGKIFLDEMIEPVYRGARGRATVPSAEKRGGAVVMRDIAFLNSLLLLIDGRFFAA